MRSKQPKEPNMQEAKEYCFIWLFFIKLCFPLPPSNPPECGCKAVNLICLVDFV